MILFSFSFIYKAFLVLLLTEEAQQGADTCNSICYYEAKERAALRFNCLSPRGSGSGNFLLLLRSEWFSEAIKKQPKFSAATIDPALCQSTSDGWHSVPGTNAIAHYANT